MNVWGLDFSTMFEGLILNFKDFSRLCKLCLSFNSILSRYLKNLPIKFTSNFYEGAE